MKKRLASVIAICCVAVTMSGCVKVIDKGTESQYTGEVAFDAAADSSGDWGTISEEIESNAQEISELLDGDGIKTDGNAVKGTGTVAEYIEKGPKHILRIELDDHDGDETFLLQIGSVYSGTVLRDIQTLKKFEDFTNQTEWSQYAKALNAEMHAQVVEPLAIDDSTVGKKVTFTGGATQTGTEVTITPSSLTLE